MEYLDYYDEDGNYLGFKTREEVHSEGLWHNTVHCWLYDKEGNVYFQIRKDSNTFYTTASGHVQKGETIKDAFKREVNEEIGVNVDTSNATLVGIVPWKMDKVKKDGTVVKDRAKANVYINLYEGDMTDFKFDLNEVSGVVRLNAKETLEMFSNEQGEVDSTIAIFDENSSIIKQNKRVNLKDFLVMPHETAYTKYSEILEKIIEVTS